MRLVRCRYGHLYDADQYTACPECTTNPGSRSIELTPEMPKEMGQTAVVGILGQGSSGQVYRVQQIREYAVKLIPWVNNNSRDNARREFEIARAMEDTGKTIRCLDYYEQDNASFLVQELSTPWFQWFDQHPCRVADVLFGALDVLEALEKLHARGYSHFDVKPGNLFVGEGGVKLGDFSHTVPVRVGAVCTGPMGTLPYMAPEIRDSWYYTGTEDFYSLGITMYMLLTGGKWPYSSPDQREQEARGPEDHIETLFLHEGLVQIIETATAYSPIDRYPTAQAFAAALRGFIFSHLQLIMEEIPAYRQGRLQNGFWHESTHPTMGTAGPQDTTFFEGSDFTSCAFNDGHQEAPVLSPGPVSMDADGPHYANSTPKPDTWNMWDEPGQPQNDTVPMTAIEPAAPPVQKRDSQANAAPGASEVRFTAVADRSVSRGDMRILEIAMYTGDWERKVSEEIKQEMGPETVSYTSSCLSVNSGAQVTVQLSAPGIQIEEDTLTERWNDKYLKFVFDYEVPEHYEKQQILFRAQVFFNGVKVTTLRLSVPMASGRVVPELERQDVTSAFLSYSRKDIKIVTYIAQAIRAARPDLDLFMDLEKLRTGEHWQERLDNELMKRDLLYLCWSRHAAASPWVDHEWQFMAEKKGVDAIAPIPLEGPDVCPAPAKLDQLHFDGLEVLIRSARRFADQAPDLDTPV